MLCKMNLTEKETNEFERTTMLGQGVSTVTLDKRPGIYLVTYISETANEWRVQIGTDATWHGYATPLHGRQRLTYTPTSRSRRPSWYSRMVIALSIAGIMWPTFHINRIFICARNQKSGKRGVSPNKSLWNDGKIDVDMSKRNQGWKNGGSGKGIEKGGSRETGIWENVCVTTVEKSSCKLTEIAIKLVSCWSQHK